MNREQFFQELRTALHREGFTPQPEQDELLPVEWDGLPLCRNGNEPVSEPVSEPPIWPAPCGST